MSPAGFEELSSMVKRSKRHSSYLDEGTAKRLGSDGRSVARSGTSPRVVDYTVHPATPPRNTVPMGSPRGAQQSTAADRNPQQSIVRNSQQPASRATQQLTSRDSQQPARNPQQPAHNPQQPARNPQQPAVRNPRQQPASHGTQQSARSPQQQPAPRGAQQQPATRDLQQPASHGTQQPARSPQQQPAPRELQQPAARPASRNDLAAGGYAAAIDRRNAASSAPATASGKRYISSLDGLRAFAVIAVILYHLGITWAKSGLLGVTIFFVLSGYLITGLLITEREETGRINLPHFWLRRVRRLVPAIVTLIVVVAALCALFNHELLTKMRPDIAPSLFFYTNWWYIFRDISYFDAIGSPSPLTHFWSLAIEEQFYLIWPVLLLLVYKLNPHKKVLRRGCLVLAAVSALVMALLFDPTGDPSRVYYGTDTRAMSLLIGAWLAFLWPGQRFTEENTSQVPQSTIWLLDGAAIAALVAIVIIMITVSGFSSFLYYGGIALVSLLTALIIAALVHPRSMLARFASLKPFVWIGKRSYGMYLWHFPIILLLAPLVNHVGGYPWWFDLIVFGLTFGIAGLSYRFIEKPIRGGAIGDLVRKVKSGQVRLSTYTLQHAVPVVASIAVLCVAVVGCAIVPDTSLVPKDAIVSTGADAGAGMTSEQMEQARLERESQAMQVADTRQPSESAPTAPSASTPQSAAVPSSSAVHEDGKSNPLLIGDSVPGDAEDDFYANFPNGFLDSYIGRRLSQAIDVYGDYDSQGVVGHVVVIANFSNFLTNPDQLEELVTTIGKDHQIYLVNVFIPDDWMGEANDIIANCAASHDNVHVIDWYSVCNGHESEYLYDDMTHLRPTGAGVYMKMIRDAITPDMPAEDLG